MPEISGVIFLVFFGLWIWGLLDIVATDAAACRNLPKVGWFVIVLLFGALGTVAWLLAGRPPKERWMPRTTDFSTPGRPVGHEDRPDFSQRPEITDRRSAELDRRLEAWEAEQRARNADLETRDRDAGPSC